MKPHATKRPEAAPSAAQSDRLITTRELSARTTLSRSTLWRRSRDGSFPAPVKLTPTRIGWRWSAVLAWLREREENPVEARAYFRKPKAASTETASR